MRLLVLLTTLMMSNLVYAGIEWKDYNEENLQTAVKEGKKVILGFHKKGCGTCHTQDAALLETGVVKNKNIVFLKVARKKQEHAKVYEKYGFSKRQWASLVLLENGREISRVKPGITDKAAIKSFAQKAI